MHELKERTKSPKKESHIYANPANVQLNAKFFRKRISVAALTQGADKESMNKVEFMDEELAQIAELVRENFDVYGYDPDSHTDTILQSIFKKITGSDWCKQG